MKSMERFTMAVLATGVALLFQCADRPSVTSTNTGEHPAIIGTLLNADGSVCMNARVSVCAKAALADTGARALPKVAASEIVTTSDTEGRYSFDTGLSPDVYVVSACSGDNAALIDSVQVEADAPTIDLASATLKPAGAIRGKVALSGGAEAQNAYALVFGVNRFSRTGADGGFILDNLAEGNYALRFLPGSGRYGARDTGGVSVFSAETTDVGTVSLHAIDPFAPATMTLTFDTFPQIVYLRWNRCGDAAVNGYNVYRRNAGAGESFTFPYNESPLVDTIFIDSLCMQDQTYEYAVTSLSNGSGEGNRSETRVVTIGSYLVVDTVFSDVEGDIGNDLFYDFSVSPTGSIYVPLTSGKVIRKYTPVMQPDGEFGTGIYQYGRIRATDDRIFALQLDQAAWKWNILSIPMDGALIDTVITADRSIVFDAKNGLLVTAEMYPDSSIDSGIMLSVFTYDGNFRTSWRCERNFRCESICVADSGSLFIALADINSALLKIIRCDLQGNTISEMAKPDCALVNDMVYNKEKQLLYVAYEEIRPYQLTGPSLLRPYARGVINVYDANYSLVACYWVVKSGGITALNLGSDGSLFAGVFRFNWANPAIGGRIIKLKPVER